jgi:uracil-DNA glycosylase family 4
MIRPTPLPQLPARPACTLCPLSTLAKTRGIATHYLSTSLPPPAPHPCVVLGQNPGYNEDLVGIPFIGASGKDLQDAYVAGISLHTLASVYLANTARCYHVNGDGPTDSHYSACRHYLTQDLHTLSSLHAQSPVVVLCVGAPAAKHLFALAGTPRASLSYAFSHQGARLSIPLSFHPQDPHNPRNTPCPSNESPAPSSPSRSPPPMDLSPSSSPTTTPTLPERSPAKTTTVPNTSPTKSTPSSSTANKPGSPRKTSKSSAPSSPKPSPPPATPAPVVEVIAFATYHPAAVARTRRLAYAVQDHLQLLLNFYTNAYPVPSTPRFIPPRLPR